MKQSPPPEPTPSPPPQPPSAAKVVNNVSNYDAPSYPRDNHGDAMMGGSLSLSSTTAANMSHANNAPNYATPLPQYHQASASPAPISHPHQYTQQGSSSYSQPHHNPANPSQPDHYSTPARRYAPAASQHAPGSNLPAQRLPEVGHLPENANLAIPEEIRNQFQQDEHGHVLWFTSPPVDTLPPSKPRSAVGHTARYLANKIRAKKAAQEKRKAEDLPEDEEERAQRAIKKAKQGVDGDLEQQIKDLTVKAIWKWNGQMQADTDKIYESLYGELWEEGKKYELEKLAKAQTNERQRQAELAQKKKKSDWEEARDACRDSGIYKDDLDPRF